jgi:hypothetical protein
MGGLKMDRNHWWRMTVRSLGVLVVGALALSAPGCTPDFVTNSQGDVLLTITEITASAGSGPEADQDTSFLISDVVTAGSVFNDNATVTLRADLKNGNAGITTGSFNDVLLERYDVAFTRTDGLNTPGVDVPYPFSGPLAAQVPAGGTGEAVFILVRHEAKREPPLRNMFGGGGNRILHCIATITIHGRSTSGKAVEATGRLEVTFADFADE